MIKTTIKYNGKVYRREVKASGVRHWKVKGKNGKWQYVRGHEIGIELDRIAKGY